MLLTEYNEARQMELFREDGIREGLQKGLQKGRQEGRLEGRLEGRQEGRQEGQSMLAALISKLFSLGRAADAERAARDAAYREKLFMEFGIH